MPRGCGARRKSSLLSARSSHFFSDLLNSSLPQCPPDSNSGSSARLSTVVCTVGLGAGKKDHICLVPFSKDIASSLIIVVTRRALLFSHQNLFFRRICLLFIITVISTSPPPTLTHQPLKSCPLTFQEVWKARTALALLLLTIFAHACFALGHPVPEAL